MLILIVKSSLTSSVSLFESFLGSRHGWVVCSNPSLCFYESCQAFLILPLSFCCWCTQPQDVCDSHFLPSFVRLLRSVVLTLKFWFLTSLMVRRSTVPFEYWAADQISACSSQWGGRTTTYEDHRYFSTSAHLPSMIFQWNLSFSHRPWIGWTIWDPSVFLLDFWGSTHYSHEPAWSCSF